MSLCVSTPITSMWTSDQPRTTVIDVPSSKLGRTHYWVRTGFRCGDLFYQSLRVDSVQSQIIIHVLLPVVNWSEPFAGCSRLGHYQYVNGRFCVSSVGGFLVAVSMTDHTCLCVCVTISTGLRLNLSGFRVYGFAYALFELQSFKRNYAAQNRLQIEL